MGSGAKERLTDRLGMDQEAQNTDAVLSVTGCVLLKRETWGRIKAPQDRSAWMHGKVCDATEWLDASVREPPKLPRVPWFTDTRHQQ